MTLIKSISGIRGTIGGRPSDNLTPIDIVKFTAAYAEWLKEDVNKKNCLIVVGRDARISGQMVENIVISTLQASGCNVINLGLATTPTVEIAVTNELADGGIILTASHNPKQWNALKLLNNKGEFISAQNGERILDLSEKENFIFSDVDTLGTVAEKPDYEEIHIRQILELPFVDTKAITEANFKIAIDCVNSVGGISIPKLLLSLGVNEIVPLYCTPDGHFPHNPEPLPEHLTTISETVRNQQCDLGFVVDPDVDRLAIVNEDGTMFGEEYTLVAIADYILSNKPGNTVSNLSSSRALRDITIKHKGEYHAAAVGEVNVVAKMREVNAVIGGEGNGGIIYPAFHYGRDALVGIALFLSQLAKSGKSCSELRHTFPEYVISKNKIELTPEVNVDQILLKIKEMYQNEKITDIDGVKIDFEEGWVHLRKSNTEPIIRIYAESKSRELADNLAGTIINKIKSLK